MINLGSINFQGIKIYYRKGSVDENVLDHSFEKDIFFKAIPSFSSTKNGLVIDVGAHIGTFTLLAGLKYSQTLIYAIEASSESFEILIKNISSSNLDNIRAFHFALSDRSGFENLFLSEENWANRIVGDESVTSFERVPSITLESFFNTYQINKCDLIKLNCEGAEFKIILSTPEYILRKIQMMLILFHEDFEPNYSRQDLMSYLKMMGFSINLVNPSKDRGWIIAER